LESWYRDEPDAGSVHPCALPDLTPGRGADLATPIDITRTEAAAAGAEALTAVAVFLGLARISTPCRAARGRWRECTLNDSGAGYQGICRFVCRRPFVLAAVPPPVQIITPSSIMPTTS
jgi:hypothetical protein